MRPNSRECVLTVGDGDFPLLDHRRGGGFLLQSADGPVKIRLLVMVMERHLEVSHAEWD